MNRRAAWQMHRVIRRYCLCAVAMAALLVLAVGALNAVYDPFGITCSETPARTTRLERSLRLHQLACRRPGSLLLGTSRVTFGMQAADYAPDAYNLGIAAATSYEIRRYFEHAQHLQPVRQAVLMFDFYSVVRIPQSMPGFRDEALSVAADGTTQPWGGLLDRIGVAFSTVTLRSLLHMVHAESRGVPGAVSYSLQGDGLDFGGARLTRTIGDRPAFLRHEKSYLQSRWRAFQQQTAAAQAAQLQRRMADIEAMLMLACRNRTTFTVAVSPSHAWHWQGMQLAGMTVEQEQFLRRLLQVRNQVARQGGCPAVPVWDFSGVGGVTAEPVPADDQQLLEYWNDAGHFKPAVGRMVLAALRGEPVTTLPVAQLTEAGLGAHFLQQREALARWAEAHPADVQALEALMPASDARSTDTDAEAQN